MAASRMPSTAPDSDTAILVPSGLTALPSAVWSWIVKRLPKGEIHWLSGSRTRPLTTSPVLLNPNT